MKYLKIIATLTLLSCIGYFYLYIPTTIKVSSFKVSASHELTAHRLLNDPKLLTNSVAPYFDIKKNKIVFEDIEFQIYPALSNMIQIDIATKNINTKSFITANAITKETTAINWFLEFKTSWNPLKRYADYQEAIKIKKATSKLLNLLNDYVENPTHIYGFDIKELTLKDTVLISTKFINKQLPTTDQIYKAANELNAYLRKFQKTPLNNPMVTVLENPTNDYTIMVGISINGEIPETNDFKIKRMPVNGKMFVTDVVGGSQNIQSGYAALKAYLLDSKRPSPAVPFELLVTDRIRVRDTAQWQTRIYYPVM